MRVRIGAALGATVVVCSILGSVSPLRAATDPTTRAACARIAKARTGSTIDAGSLKVAADQLARSNALGARSIADQLREARRKPTTQALAVRQASAWCVRVLGLASPVPTTIAPIVVTQHFEGVGNTQIALDPRTNGAALARIGAGPAQVFTVQSSDASGNTLATVVDAAGPYEGIRPLNLEAGARCARLDVTSNGAWSIDIIPLTQAPRVTTPGHYDGVGDQVLVIQGDSSRAHFDARAPAGRFRVDGYGLVKATLIDEPSPFEGTVVTPLEAKAVLEIRSEGAWSVDLS